jgi:hypothetical protein
MAHRSLKGSFSREQADALISGMWEHYDELTPCLPAGISPTGKFLMKLSSVDYALYNSLVDNGAEKDDARKIILDVNWSVLGGGTLLGKALILFQYKLSRLVSRDPARRLEWCLMPLWRFVFTIPPWEKHNLPIDHGVFAVDVTRCPFAEYFESIGQPDFGAETICAVDNKLAELWGFELKRSGLLMTGASRCDFRFTPITQATGADNKRAD